MNIQYDGYIYGIQAAGGLNRYFANLIARLPPTWTPVLRTARQGGVNFPQHPRLQVVRSFGFRPWQAARALNRVRYTLRPTPPPDLLHPTFYWRLDRRQWGSERAPLVLTVADFVHEQFPAQLDPDGGFARLKCQAIQAADAVLCISQHTKRDLLERCPIPESRLHVTYLASELSAALITGAEPIPDAPYFLSIGARGGYKNFDGLVRAFARLAQSNPHVQLCVVGGPWSEAEGKLLSEEGVTDRVQLLGHLGDAHLAALYRGALALVYPSHYEGFGIPPLEAMSCGTLAIVGDNSSLPEVVGEAGLLFPSHDQDALVALLRGVADGWPQRDALIQRGYERAALFSWDQTAAQTFAVYKQVVGKMVG